MKKLTGFPSQDKPQNRNAKFHEIHPIIPNTNIYNILKFIRKNDKDKIAISSLGEEYTYRQLFKDAKNVSFALRNLGIRHADIVTITMPNIYQAIVIFLACNRIGATATFLDYNASYEEICSYINEFSSKVYFNFDKEYNYNVKIKENSCVGHIITLFYKNRKEGNARINKENKRIFIDYSDMENLAEKRKYKFEFFHSAKERALILFTSGSTGIPKSVVLTNENIIAAEIYLKNTATDKNIIGTKTLVCVPFSYPYGLITSALTTLFWGKEAILADNIGKSTIDLYFNQRPNIVFGSPALLELIVKNLQPNRDLSFLSYFISGGDFLPLKQLEDAKQFFRKHNANVFIGNGYGNAETVSCGANPIGVPLKVGTVGKILVGTNAMILNIDTGREMKYNEEGVLCVSGKHVFKEYYNDFKLTQEVKLLYKGKIYYNTGVIGFIDQDGYLTITGRQSRFYITSSLNKVYCDHVQNIISAYDCVRECAVVKVPDDNFLFVNMAFIVLESHNNLTKDIRLETLFKTPVKGATGKDVQLKSYEIPSYIEIVDDLPRKSGSGKVDYQLLEKIAEEKVIGK